LISNGVVAANSDPDDTKDYNSNNYFDIWQNQSLFGIEDDHRASICRVRTHSSWTPENALIGAWLDFADYYKK
jgi:hypothetical protein